MYSVCIQVNFHKHFGLTECMLATIILWLVFFHNFLNSVGACVCPQLLKSIYVKWSLKSQLNEFSCLVMTLAVDITDRRDFSLTEE